MFMDALEHFRIAIVCVLVTAGCSCCSFRAAALIVMLRVMFTQIACTYGYAASCLCAGCGSYRLRAERKQHGSAKQRKKRSASPAAIALMQFL